VVKSQSTHKNGVDFDIRGERSGVIAPPSVHQYGHEYVWVRDLSFLKEWPGDSDNEPAKEDTSQLSDLLTNIPEKGGRNDWLTRICGHYAAILPYKDAYEAQVKMLAAQMPEPLVEDEVNKVIESVWKIEHNKPTNEEFNVNNGYLVGDGTQLYTQTVTKQQYNTEPIGNFDLICNRFATKSNGTAEYEVTIQTATRPPQKVVLNADIFGNQITISRALSSYRVGVLPPPNDAYRHPIGERLRRYLDNQNAELCQYVDYLGWYEGEGFVCHEGLITEDGLQPHRTLVPDPKLKNWAPYHYGFESPETVRKTLQEVLTYHDEMTVAVFGAWWASIFLKPMIENYTAIYPSVVLDSPSESGKTNGFFGLMNQLSGNVGGQRQLTPASMRDAASCHNSGILWIDDLTSVDAMWDLIRQAASGGTVVKKAEDHTEQVHIKMLTPIIISGEGFASVDQEKALRDRVISIVAGSPTGRVSLHNPDRPQWDDIVALQSKWRNDLSAMAGTIVQIAIQNRKIVDDIPSLRAGSGRMSEKIAVMRVGARMLSILSGQSKWTNLIDDWAKSQVKAPYENEDMLLSTILPNALREFGVPMSPGNNVPIYLTKDGLIRWSEPGLSAWWRSGKRTPREMQLGTVKSIRAQKHAAGIVAVGERVWVDRERGLMARYQELPKDFSDNVISIAGFDPDAIRKNNMAQTSVDVTP
jgi:hypothetical protein